MRGRLNEKLRFGDYAIEKMKLVDLYQTREELKEAEERCEGRINWEKWDELVQEVKQQLIQAFGVNNTTKSPKYIKPVWAYNFNAKQIATYTSALEASKELEIPHGTVSRFARELKPLLYKKLIVSYRPLTRQELVNIIDKKHNEKKVTEVGRPAPVPKWVYNSDTYEFLGYFSSTFEAAETFGMTANQVNYQAWIERPYKKLKLLILNQPLEEWKKKQEEENQ